MPTKKLTIHRITEDDLLCLLDKKDAEVLQKLNKSEFGFISYLCKRSYTDGENKAQILEMIIQILSRVCSIKRLCLRAQLNRFLRMLIDCEQCLFDDVPRLIYSCMAEEQYINLITFMANYMTILMTLLHTDYFPFEKILNEIFPALENYMNRLRERRVADLDKAEGCFQRLRRVVEKLDESADLDDEEDDFDKDFRTLSVVPRSNDIVNYELPNIPQNIIDRPYKNVDHFLSVHYRLMREDMLRSFRECIKNCISHSGQKITKSNIYKKVFVRYPPEYTVDGIIYDIEVTTSEEIDWSKKEILLPGSLVFLTPNDFLSVVFATVKKNPRADYGKSKKISLKIKLEDDQFKDELFKDLQYTMVEPSAYFECYKHVLSAIKDFSETTFPLSDIITYLDHDDPEPRYIDELTQYCLHEKCNPDEPGQSCSCKRFNVLKAEEWPTLVDLKLDEMQYNAFQIALTKKVAVIQGPPGTGKTYIGVKFVKALLSNVPYKPIVICCLTNHALDQFLERILSYTKKVIRLGSQSKSEILEPHKIDNMIYAIRQHHQGNVDKSLNKSRDLVKKIANIVLEKEMRPEHEQEYYEIRALSESIKRYLSIYSLCQEKYLEDSALNKIIGSKYKDQLRYAAGVVRKSLSAGVLEWLVCSRSADLYEKCCKKFKQFGNKSELDYHVYIENIWTLTERKRYELFYFWRKKCLAICKKNLENEIEEYKSFMIKFKDKPQYPEKLELIRGADVIGVTTTGACKFRDLLRFAEPRILVVEEAAQVLESHIIASLVPSIQHLIMIGDHEQLRPLPADNELSEKYNLKVSMFERLFHNHAPSATLILQHRMKPCIAELLVPRPYTEYKSYDNVYKYEEIRGVESSVFFFDHRTFEDENSSGVSSSNDFEARMVVSLAKYLSFIHYSSDEITILATYAAQVILIHKYLQGEKLLKIKVTTVDNFQGEENDIILLSFVRSNESVIGFLKESNRVCVALSRARKGMFCFGNFQLFADKNELWFDIVEKLRVKNMIGDTLSLKCFRHQTIHQAKSAEDILAFISNGCTEDCNLELPCMHKCTRKCHFVDSDHLYYLCKEPCRKMIDETRVCPRRCYEKCKRAKKTYIELPCGHVSSRSDSKCFEEVTHLLPCTHEVTIPCHVDVEQYQCKAVVYVILDCGHKVGVRCYEKKFKSAVVCTDLRQEIGPCGHTIDVPCSIQLNENDILALCDKPCGDLLDCRHPCVGSCHSCSGNGIHALCREKCELILTCGHKCSGYCGRPCPPCKKKCFLSCGHRTSCINDCLRPCIKCEKACERVCRHKRCTKMCWEDCSVEPCMEPCIEILPCGHKCIGLCGDPCPYLCRECHADHLTSGNNENTFYVQLDCDHVIEINEMNQHISDRLLSFEWPYCPQCSKSITQSLRFKKELKQAKKICIENADVSEEISTIHYLIESMYGKDYIVPAHFIPVNNEISQILKQGNPYSDTLLVLKTCIILLKKLLIISSAFNESNCDEYIQGKFDTLMLWIRRHLTDASFQQLRELEAAVNQLQNDVLSTTRLRLND